MNKLQEAICHYQEKASRRYKELKNIEKNSTYPYDIEKYGTYVKGKAQVYHEMSMILEHIASLANKNESDDIDGIISESDYQVKNGAVMYTKKGSEKITNAIEQMERTVVCPDCGSSNTYKTWLTDMNTCNECYQQWAD